MLVDRPQCCSNPAVKTLYPTTLTLTPKGYYTPRSYLYIFLSGIVENEAVES
jgi:hypothetical protein